MLGIAAISLSVSYFSHYPTSPLFSLFLFPLFNQIMVSADLHWGHTGAKSLCFSIKKLGWRLHHREAERRGLISPQITKRKIISLHTTVRDLNDIKRHLMERLSFWYDTSIWGKRQNPAGGLSPFKYYSAAMWYQHHRGKLQPYKSWLLPLFKICLARFFLSTELVSCYIIRQITAW